MGPGSDSPVHGATSPLECSVHAREKQSDTSIRRNLNRAGRMHLGLNWGSS